MSGAAKDRFPSSKPTTARGRNQKQRARARRFQNACSAYRPRATFPERPGAKSRKPSGLTDPPSSFIGALSNRPRPGRAALFSLAKRLDGARDNFSNRACAHSPTKAIDLARGAWPGRRVLFQGRHGKKAKRRSFRAHCKRRGGGESIELAVKIFDVFPIAKSRRRAPKGKKRANAAAKAAPIPQRSCRRMAKAFLGAKATNAQGCASSASAVRCRPLAIPPAKAIRLRGKQESRQSRPTSSSRRPRPGDNDHQTQAPFAGPLSRSKPYKRRRPRNGHGCPSSASEGLCGPWRLKRFETQLKVIGLVQ